jgi:uncharacterized membrane protein
VNDRGEVVGAYRDASRQFHGFLLSGGEFKPVEFPGARGTLPFGLNSRGDVTGMYFLPGDEKHYGFVMTGGTFTSLDHSNPNDMSCAMGVNDSGEAAGHIREANGAYRGYLWKDGKFTLVDVPGASKGQMWDSVYEIGAAGDLLGTYTDATGKQRGYLRRNGTFTPFDAPGARLTRAFGVNRSGQVVGTFQDGSVVTHGFVGRP